MTYNIKNLNFSLAVVFTNFLTNQLSKSLFRKLLYQPQKKRKSTVL